MGPVKTCASGCSRGGAQQRLQPSGANLHVVVDEHQQLAVGVGDAGVAGGVQPERPRVGEVAGAEALGERADLGRGPVVLDHQQLGPGGGGLRGDRGERDLEIVGALAGGDDDRGGGAVRFKMRVFWMRIVAVRVFASRTF